MGEEIAVKLDVYANKSSFKSVRSLYNPKKTHRYFIAFTFIKVPKRSFLSNAIEEPFIK